MPKLTIITINLNNANGLQKTIHSVINQLFSDYEYIVIDGKSDDSSKKIIEQYSSRISFWISETDSGIYNAMNKGLMHASGEYCLFLNSGDYLVKNTVLKKVFDSNIQEDIIYGNIIFKRGNHFRRINFPGFLTFSFMHNEYLGHAATLIKRNLFLENGMYNEEYKVASDWEFFLKVIFLKNCSTKHLTFPISVIEEGGISNNPAYTSQVKAERNQILKTHFPRFVRDYQEYNNFNRKGIFTRIKSRLKRLFNTLT